MNTRIDRRGRDSLVLIGERRVGGMDITSGEIRIRRDYMDFGTHRVECGWIVSGRYCGGITGVWYGTLRAALTFARRQVRRAIWIRTCEIKEDTSDGYAD